MSRIDQPGSSTRRYSRSIAGHNVLFDREHFLWQPDDWNEDIAKTLARESGLNHLGEKHWRVINFLREFYYYNGRAPLNRQIVKGVGLNLLEIKKLVPGGIKHGARRIAGLPNPKNCL